jgi:hypothetical protein
MKFARGRGKHWEGVHVIGDISFFKKIALVIMLFGAAIFSQWEI